MGTEKGSLRIVESNYEIAGIDFRCKVPALAERFKVDPISKFMALIFGGKCQLLRKTSKWTQRF